MNFHLKMQDGVNLLFKSLGYGLIALHYLLFLSSILLDYDYHNSVSAMLNRLQWTSLEE